MPLTHPTLSGTLTSAKTKTGIANLKVVLSEQKLRGKNILLETATDANGAYAFKLDGTPGKTAYVVEIKDKNGKTLATSGTFFQPNEDISFDFLIEDERFKGNAAFELHKTVLQDYLNELNDGGEKKPLTVEEVYFVAKQTNHPPKDTFHWLRAHELELETKISAEVFYGLFSQGLPSETNALYATKGKSLKEALTRAADDNIVSDAITKDLDKITAQWNDFVIGKALEEKNEYIDATIGDVLTVAVADKSMQRKIMGAYLQHEGTGESFLNDLHQITGNIDAANQIQLAMQLATITGHQPDMIKSLMADHLKEKPSNPILALAGMEPDEWAKYITALSKAKKKSVVPVEVEGEDENERVLLYAKKLSKFLETNYPTHSFFGKLGKRKAVETAFREAHDDLLVFFDNNPSFNIKSTQTLALSAPDTAFNFKNIKNKNQLINELQGIQRLSAITSRFNAISLLRQDGLDSASKIVKVPQRNFVARYTKVFGSVDATIASYFQAKKTAMYSLMLTTNIYPSINMGTAATPTAIANPSIRTMFGNLDSCECEHCTSVLSPAAYFTDILHFIQNRTRENENEDSPVFKELLRRRPDLVHIELSCENTNTPLPYIDLVNELLENFVLTHKNPSVEVPKSYQTTWQAPELAANPEHINYEAYSELNKAVYPSVLPFNLPLEEARGYLNHLGVERHNLMTTFFAGNPNQAFDDFYICMERLGFSKKEADILSGTTIGDGSGNSGTWNFYGFDKETGYKPLTDPADSSKSISGGNWKDVLSGRVDVFLQQTELGYKDMLTMLLCDFINPQDRQGVRPISIVSKDPSKADTCELNLLEIKGLSDTSFLKIHRFLRLWRKLGWSMYDLDKAALALNLRLGANIEASKTGLKQISQADDIRRRLNLPLENVLAFWTNINTTNYTDYFNDNYPLVLSLFDKLFRNKAVQNPIDPAFEREASQLEGRMDDHQAAILAALQLNANDYQLLISNGVSSSVIRISTGEKSFATTDGLPYLEGDEIVVSFDNDNFMVGKVTAYKPETLIVEVTAFKGNGEYGLWHFTKTNLTLSNLSWLYRNVQLAKALKLNIQDFISLKLLIGENPFESPLSTDRFLSKAETLKTSGFTLAQLNYLLRHDHSNESNVAPDDSDINVFLEGLSTALETAEASTAEGRRKIMVQKFSEKLKITTAATGWLLGDNPRVSQLHQTYIRAEKSATIINRLKLSDVELENILAYHSDMECTDIASLPVVASTPPFNGFQEFENLLNLVKARDILPNGSPDLFTILYQSIVSNSKNNWLTGLANRTAWDRETIEILVGNGETLAASGILKAKFPDDFKNGNIILQIKNVLAALNTIGLKASLVEKAIQPSLDETVSNDIKNAVKAKYSEAQWLKIAKPLRDGLREQQRKALVAYAISHSNYNIDNQKFERWKNSDELYEYLLIDVEMKPISMTSRIKQAICSVQLYIDRVLMNLEHPNSNPVSTSLKLTPEQAEEWKKWRKLYRVWEANRKIFLYPENWIEPELRDDKSPFFKELETQLKQNELTVENVEDAFRVYLEKLDEVARLEVVGFHHQREPATDAEEAIDILHVFARTYANPHKYFHRTLEYGEWTPWVRLEIDIDGNHIVPVVFNRKLCLFWLFFTQENVEQSSSTARPQYYWKIQVSWSELKNKKWTAKKLSKSSLFSTKSGSISNLQSLKEQIWTDTIIDDDLLYINVISTGNPTLGAFIFNDTNTDPIAGAMPIARGRPRSGPVAVNQRNPLPLSLINVVPKEQMMVANADATSFSLHLGFDDDYEIAQPNHGAVPSLPDNLDLSILSLCKENKYKIILPAGDFFKPQDKYLFFQDAKNTFCVEHNIIPRSKPLNFSNVRFTFTTFYHAHVKTMIKELNKLGVKGLLKLDLIERLTNTISFNRKYAPNTAYVKNEPTSTIDFSYTGPYSQYNWELFFQVPMLIACRLKDDQRFEEARNWFHFIFDPTNSNGGGKERFWQFKPFHIEAQTNITSLQDLMENSSELDAQVEKWMQNPFKPHVIARMRTSAYMKNVVMKYIDNLIAWGDNLFKRDTIESINEATNLYILAANILGQRPQEIPPRATHEDSTFDTLQQLGLDSFSNTRVAIETMISPSVSPASGTSAESGNELGDMFYFCLPRNENLLKYWDTVADRLFKIRHSMNIEGLVRTLPLFEPPIDPALLVRAAAGGVDLSSILSDSNAQLPSYRFTFMLQKANDFVNEVKGLGSALLQALEKRDSETMSLLRSQHEQKMLDATLVIKQKQVEDSKTAIESLKLSLEMATLKSTYYQTRTFMNSFEAQHLDSMQLGLILSTVQGGINMIGGILAATPNFKVAAPTSIGATFGGDNLGAVMGAVSNYLGLIAGINSAQGAMASTLGGYTRRMDDWQLQAKSALKEIAQLEKQALSAEIRLAIAEKDLQNHQLQMDNTQEMDELMRSKFTNQELYDWMVGQLSTVYFQSYQLAFDLAKKAEKCYQYELGQYDATSFVQFGYWDSLKKGLLSAEKLQYDLRRMEASFYEQNNREFELTKNISLLLLSPQAILDLREKGSCEFVLPEALFDLDFQGHFFRRIKSVSISIPCIAGPYTSVNATLRLLKHTTRLNTSRPNYESPDYSADANDFRHIPSETHSVATSNAQSDSGMFELNFRDERYLPFEGCGVISAWKLELVEDKALRMFDYDTISDVVMTMRYTAKEDAGLFKNKVTAYLKGLIANTLAPTDGNGLQLWRMFSGRHEFPSEWYKLFHPSDGVEQKMEIEIGKNRFPFYAQERAVNVKIKAIHVYGYFTATEDYDVEITSASGIASKQFFTLTSGSKHYHFNDVSGIDFEIGKFNIRIKKSTAPDFNSLTENEVKDLMIVLEYQLAHT